MASVLIPLADGFEELEAVTIIDLLVRAGVEVVSAGLKPGAVKGSRGVVLVPDRDLDTALQREFDMVVLPGGMPGARHLEEDARVIELVQEMAARGAWTAAICAAPRVLGSAGLLSGKQATSYPGFLDKMGLPDVTYTDAPVQQDGRVITSRGPGTAMDFALTLIELLTDRQTRDSVEAGLLRP